MAILLSSEEMKEVACGIPPRKLGEDYSRLMEATALAQLRKVAEWVGGNAPFCSPAENIELNYCDWQVLQKEAGL